MKVFINLLSITRLFAIFIVIALYYLMPKTILSVLFQIIVYSLLYLTDMLDGYLARKYNQSSALGKVLDSISDKVYLMGTLFFIIYTVNIGTFIYIMLVLSTIRDIIIAGLREYWMVAGLKRIVLKSARWKVLIQAIGSGFLLYSSIIGSNYSGSFYMIGAVVFTLGTIISLYTAYKYIYLSLKE